jgi:protein-L-isoaspartate(D-aspartate) O-methyltransferase
MWVDKTQLKSGTHDIIRKHHQCIYSRNHAWVLFTMSIGVIFMILGWSHQAQADGRESHHARQKERDEMVDRQIVEKGITDHAVIAAMRRVPRHRFIPHHASEDAYGDFPLAIGHRQTISQPYIVAYMTQALTLQPNEKVLEIGTGSGYQAAILGELGIQVFTIEIVKPLGEKAKEVLAELGYSNVTVRIGDGYQGWPEESPFDAIILTAAPDHIPSPLLEQLAIGGRLILPVGDRLQHLMLIHRTAEGYQQTNLLPVVFVPMTGESEKQPSSQ